MNLSHALPFAALAASALLLFTARARIPAVFAAAASGLEMLLASGAIGIHASRIPISLVLGAVLLVAGVIAYMRVAAKSAVSAATVVTLVGLVQVLRGFRGF